MDRVAGKVALITGAARGQGRNHAVRLAAEGADIVAVDLCEDIATVPYPMATAAELDETVRAVEALDRRCVAVQADVRDPAAMAGAVSRTIAELGRLDVVVANAAVSSLGSDSNQVWVDTVDINLLGVINTIHAAYPHLRSGASIIAIGSLVAVRPRRAYDEAGPGSAGYKYAKLAVAQYIHELATALAPEQIRANVIHPTNVESPMLLNDSTYRQFRRDLDEPTREDAQKHFAVVHAMPVPYVSPDDISHAVVYLASDESRYLTGNQLRVDAAGYLKVNAFHP
ncbi:mycofactocin-coupled SDR family oxidoreductase [uncultured Jatrophihabitans sp.]|uniref:mycofactocin-coupled SDR family oxidoreductase n=1 Tax=uncultured Jatrophihabitans sp. TaxID=1610747 RepID=UPI0035CBC08E